MNNRHLRLSLAVALAVSSPSVLALGLGQLQVKSGLGQPLVAEIPIISATPSELDQLDVRLASPEAFSRVGLDRPGELTANLQFSLGKNASGQPVIRISTPGRFNEPFLSFLIEAEWGKGAVTREYTALIDPPYIAPAVIQPLITPSVASAPPPAPIAPPVAAAPPPEPEPEPAEVAPIAESAPEPPAPAMPEPEPTPIAEAPAPVAPPPAPEPRPAPPPQPRPQAVVPPPRPAPAPTPEPEPARPAAPAPAKPGEIGPIAPGQTLWSIASAARPDPAVSVNQMMVALLRANPDAFAKDNINLLKRGSVLRVPGQEEINRLSPEEAASLVSQQAIAWRSPRQPVPQPEENVAEAPAPSAAKPTASAAPRPSPPRATAARPARAASRLEITPPAGNRAARGAQSGAAAGAGGTELRAELAQAREDLAARTSEVAELKSRVSDLEKQDADRQRLIDLQNSQLKELQDRLKQMEAEQAAAVPAASPVATLDAAPGATPPAAPASAPADPAAATAAVATAPITPDKPWYLNPLILVGGVLLVLGGLVLALRRSRPATDNGDEPAPMRLSDDDALRASMAKTRQAAEKIVPAPTSPATPVVLAAATKPASADASDLALQALKDAVKARPQDLEAHLSLLRFYHSRGNATEYEVAAQAMRAQLPTTMDPRWREAVIMGASLLPGQALFSQAGWNSPRFNEAEASAATPAVPPPAAPAPPPPAARAPVAAAPAAPRAATPVAAAPAAVAAAPVRVFEPPVEEVINMADVTPGRSAANASAGVAPKADDDNPFGDFKAPNNDIHRSEAQMAVEDEASATRIELAKAYLAIGDLEGARSMLEEVLAEGGPTAQSEAGRILKEIG